MWLFVMITMLTDSNKFLSLKKLEFFYPVSSVKVNQGHPNTSDFRQGHSNLRQGEANTSNFRQGYPN